MAGEIIGLVLRWALPLWLAALALVVGWGAWRARGDLIQTARDLFDRDGQIGFDRLQLLAVAVVAAIAYLTVAIDVIVRPGARHAMPDVPQNLIILLTASQSVYLSAQAARSVLKGGASWR